VVFLSQDVLSDHDRPPHADPRNHLFFGRRLKMIHAMIFEKKPATFRILELDESLRMFREQNGTVWIDLFQPTLEELETVGKALDIHELTLEDLGNPHVRPKVEEFADHLFVVFKALNLNEGEERLDVINLNCLLFRNGLITAHLKPLLPIRDAQHEMPVHPSELKKGPSFLMYQILDRVVDQYFPLMDEVEDVLDDMQSRIFEKFDKSVSQGIFEWKGKIAHLRRHLGPQREILMNLSNRHQLLIPEKVQVYFRDVYDHVVRIHDALESYRDILQGAMDSYMTQVSNRMNEVMKVLSIVATVMLPLGILTGLYGTNFRVLPGANEPYAFWVFVGMMLAVAGGFTIFFKCKKWF
jgi:magnesium transporter